MRELFRNILLTTALVGIGSNSVIGVEAAGNVQSTFNNDQILNVSHRGASGYAPEHTLMSYKMGHEMKGDYIEIDLQMTKDGELIALHDETLNRTTNGTGKVKDYTLAEIKELDAGSWFNVKYPAYANNEYIGLTVPTLEEVFEEFGTDARYYIETKSPDVYPGMEEKLLEVLNEYKLVGKNTASSKVIIQSFSAESLKKVHDLEPTLPLVQLISYRIPATISDDELEEYKLYAIGLGMNYKAIDESYVQKVRQHDLLIHPYTVNEKEDMKKLIDWGVSGMFTNFPDRLREVIKEK